MNTNGLLKIVALLVVVAGTTLAFIGCGSVSSRDGMTSAIGPGFTAVELDQRDAMLRPGSAASPAPGVPAAAPPALDPGDEVWVIAKPPIQVDTGRRDDVPGSGSLVTERPADKPRDPAIPQGETTIVPLPLKHTHVKGRIDATIATVDVTQQFHNPFDSKIEAVYVFPLPSSAAISDFVMTIGERKIRGIIRERAEAEKIYLDARRQGYNAALLTQERPNIFTQRVANIEPGKAIDIHIRYFHTLAYDDGWYEFHFPMVVGPRYNPAHTEAAGEGIGAVGRGQLPGGGLSGQATEIEYLRPNERSGHDISVSVELNPGVAIEEVACASHKITQTVTSEGRIAVALDAADRVPNKDFVLRYRVAGDKIKSNLLVHRDKRGGFFTLMLYPPKDLQHLPRQPMEMIFVLDCSGSMRGYPMEKSKQAIRHALKHLDTRDTFQIIDFAQTASQLGERPLPVNAQTVAAGLRYVDQLDAGGGTEMLNGLRASLDFPRTAGRERVVAFLTDGYIGNEAEVLGELHKRLNGGRVFSFGIGPSVNRYLIESMARMGRGAVGYVGPNDSGPEVMDRFFQRIAHPAMTDIEIDFGSMKVSGVYPRRVGDLFVGKPVLLVGRFEGEPPATITVRGKAGGETVAMTVVVSPLKMPADAMVNGATVGGLPAVWARMQIADLSDQLLRISDPTHELPGQITRVALDYNLMSAYTAFVAVDSSRRTEGDSGTTVNVPVPTPAGVKYETTVKE